MINNIDKIKKLLVFDSEDEFYQLQILKRKKEHPELGSNNYVVKTYQVKSIEHLDKIFPEVVCLCEFHQARACINLNRRSFEKLAYQMLRKVTDQILNKDFKSVRKAYDSVTGSFSNEPNTKWVVDIDVKSSIKIEMIQNDIKNCEPNRRVNKTIEILETKNGFHLITSPFNMEEFRKINPDIEVHKNNPTILFIP